jgi:hypothetical protein
MQLSLLNKKSPKRTTAIADYIDACVIVFCVCTGARAENRRFTTPFIGKWFVGYAMDNNTGLMYLLLSSTQPATVASAAAVTISTLPVIPNALGLYAAEVLKVILHSDSGCVSRFMKADPPAGDSLPIGVTWGSNSKAKGGKWTVSWNAVPRNICQADQRCMELGLCLCPCLCPCPKHDDDALHYTNP